MAKFCKFCGKQINDGVCDCPESVAASEAAIRQKVVAAMGGSAQAQQSTAAEAPRTAANDGSGSAFRGAAGFNSAEAQQTAQQAAQAAGVVGRQVSTMFVNIIVSPVNAMRQAIADGNKLPQYLMAIAYALLMIALVRIGGKNDFIDDDVLLMTGVRMALASLFVRAIYAAAAYALLKKHNPVLRLQDLIGVFSLTFAYDIIILVCTILSFWIGFYEIVIALMFFWGIMDALIAYLATWIISGENAEAAFRANLLIQLVLIVLLVFVGRTMVVNFVSDMIGTAMNSLGALSSWY